MYYHPQITDEIARQHQDELRRDGAQPSIDGAPSPRRQALRFTAVALASIGLALAGATLARAENLEPDGTSGTCPTPAAPVVHVVSSTAVTVASSASPDGLATRAQVIVDGAPMYAKALGHGTRRVAWQVTLRTLRPGRSYTILARAVAPGCRGEAATVFTMPDVVPVSAIPTVTDADIVVEVS